MGCSNIAYPKLVVDLMPNGRELVIDDDGFTG